MSLAGALAIPIPAMGQPTSMFSDPKAANVGDALTVIISETASATNQIATTTQKSNTTKVSSAIPGAGNVLDFVPIHALDSDFENSYGGRASTSRSARLMARITVSVVDKKANGDLIIEGVRSIKINGETEAIHLSGSVSPSMVSASNTVPSSSVGDLSVEYTGKGSMTQGTRPGVFVRLANWLF
ncbi:MAG: flagellar basal body L-ring protein FlgH [Candidatus Latescibacterota bacterium]|nr:flagellar basal body L-ring protein FlgH [Candidatus Latescibacterota bacterium]